MNLKIMKSVFTGGVNRSFKATSKYEPHENASRKQDQVASAVFKSLRDNGVSLEDLASGIKRQSDGTITHENNVLSFQIKPEGKVEIL